MDAMDPIAATSSAVTSPLLPNLRQQAAERSNQAALQTSQADLQNQISRQTATAAPGANVNVQERLTVGPDGQLVVGSATVTITQTTNPLQPQTNTQTDALQFANAAANVATGNVRGAVRADAIEDQVNISQAAQDQAGLNANERAVVQQLAARDAEVRVHEGLHFRTAGGLATAPNFQTVQGPDGNFYAVGGSVDVSSTRGAAPEQAAREAQTLGLAATAPGDASAQDLSAARQFSQSAAQNASSAEANAGQNNEILGPQPAENEPTGIAENIADTQGQQEQRRETVDFFV